MKRTPNGTKPDAMPVSDDRKQLEAANVALRNELVTAMAVINHAKQRAEDAEADLAEAESERDAHAILIAELEWQLAEAETERDSPIANMKNKLTAAPIPAPIVTAPEAAPAEGSAAAIAAELVAVMAANERKHPAPRQRKATAKPTPAPKQTAPTLAFHL